MNGRTRRLADVLSDTLDCGLRSFGNDEAVPIGHFGRGTAHSPALDLLEGVHGAVECSPQSRNFFIHDGTLCAGCRCCSINALHCRKVRDAGAGIRMVETTADNCELEQGNLVLARLLTQ